MSALLPGATANPSLYPFIALSVGGFVVGVLGHLVASRVIVALGIAMVFLGTVVLPLVLYGDPGP